MNATILAEPQGSPAGTILTTLVVLAFVAVLIGLVAIARKRLFGLGAADDGGGLTLGGMRDLVRQGKMTPEEFERTKAQIIAAAQRRTGPETFEVKPDAAQRHRRDDDTPADPGEAG